MSSREERTLQVAEQAVGLLEEEGIQSALIGAAAVAVHGYPRDTADLDLATHTDPFKGLSEVSRKLVGLGFTVELNTPDADDPLGGVLTISGDDFDDVQIVNFYNPLGRGARNPGAEAIKTALKGRVPSVSVSVVDLPHLIALKLYAGGPKGRLDIMELLTRNPNASRTEMREVCERYGLATEFDAIRASVESSSP